MDRKIKEKPSNITQNTFLENIEDLNSGQLIILNPTKKPNIRINLIFCTYDTLFRYKSNL